MMKWLLLLPVLALAAPCRVEPGHAVVAKVDTVIVNNAGYVLRTFIAKEIISCDTVKVKK